MSPIQDRVTEKVPSKGARFVNTRSPLKFLELDDDRGFAEGQEVFVGSGSNVYGPYRLDAKVAEGNGVQIWKAWAGGNDGNVGRTKPMTKAEMEAKLNQLIAENAELRGEHVEAPKAAVKSR